MTDDKGANKEKFYSIVIMLMLIVVTRALCLMHGAEIHPDEGVFEYAASSIADCVLDLSKEYEELKEYPEGAYVFQAPFYLLGKLLNNAGLNILERAFGRISAVFYFSLGAVIGVILLFRFLKAQKVHFAVYAAIIIFSLLHIEQSRYATGDAISMFLIMLIIYLSALALQQNEAKTYRWLVSASGVVGALCAVKYPLLFFCNYPCICRNSDIEEKTVLEKFTFVVAMLAALVVDSCCSHRKSLQILCM